MLFEDILRPGRCTRSVRLIRVWEHRLHVAVKSLALMPRWCRLLFCNRIGAPSASTGVTFVLLHS